MDNVLRGGYPMQLGNNKIFYVYSRKHGDLERDYNYFSMLPEFYSQGNGNFRDVNQNRRCDTFCTVRRQKEYTGILQSDPAGRVQSAWRRETDLPPSKERAKKLLTDVKEEQRSALIDFVTKPFTPGALCRKFGEVFGDTWMRRYLSGSLILRRRW